MVKTILLRDAIELYSVHSALESVDLNLSYLGILNCAKNLNSLKIIKDSYDKSSSLSAEKTKEYNEVYETEYQKLITKYAKKDEGGNIIYNDSNNETIQIVDMVRFNKEIFELKNKFPIIKEKIEKEEEAKKELDTELEVDLFPITILDNDKGFSTNFISIISKLLEYDLLIDNNSKE